MADTTSAPNFSAPFNALIQQNAAPPPNPLTQIGQAAQTMTAFSNSQTAAAQVNDAQLQNAQNHIAARIQAITPYLAKGDQVTGNDVLGGLTDLVVSSKGAFSPQEAAHFYTQLPQAPNGNLNAPNPALATAIRQHQLRLMNAMDQIATLRGTPAALDTGSGTQFGTRNSYTGAYQPQGGPNGYVPSTMSPAQAASPTPGPVNKLTGAATTEPLGQRAEEAGLAPAGTYTGQGQGGSGSGAIPVTIGANGQIMKRPTTGAVTPPQASGAIQTEASPGQAIALKAGGEAYAAAGQNASTYGQQMTQLQSALSGLRNTTTGPGTESRQAIASYMLALPGGVGQYLPGVDPKSIQAYDEANKYLTQTAQGSPNATRSTPRRSDAGLNTALASSPSVHISNAAAQDVLKANIGFRRAEMANYAAFQRSGADAGQFQSFMAQRNQQIDPRAYSVDLLSPAQRASFIQGLSPGAKSKFFNSVRDAMGSGMIDTSSFGGGAGGR